MNNWKDRRCLPGAATERLSAEEVSAALAEIPGWDVSDDGKRITRSWRVLNFLEALGFFERIGAIAEAENHHPDLHLVGYRNVTVELWTHSVGGLSVNDLILAAKINDVPVARKE